MKYLISKEHQTELNLISIAEMSFLAERYKNSDKFVKIKTRTYSKLRMRLFKDVLS